MTNKLELIWYGKENEIKVEPRILIENTALSNISHKSGYGQASILNNENTDNFDNMLIHGDNLLALKALESKFAGQVKCIYIDPPYNTGSAFEHYDDNLEHSTWLNLMYARLQILKKLLRDDGVLFVQIDNIEMHYLKIVCDEIFGRKNALTTITCKVKAPSGVASGAQMFFDCSEYILVYAKNKDILTYNDVSEDAEIVDKNSKTANFYTYVLNSINYDNLEFVAEIDGEKIYRVNPQDYDIEKMKDPSKLSYYNNFEKIFRTAALSGGREKIIKAYLDTIDNSFNSLFVYEHIPSKGKRAGKICRDLIYKNGGVLMLKDFAIKDDKKEIVIKQQHITSIFYNDWWQGIAKEGNIELKNGKKPEILIKTLLDVSTCEGDIVLDSFLGSGTTAAVAHKMKRKYIGIEMGNQVYTHCKKRLDDIILGADKTGITKVVKWKNGGGYHFYELAPSLINEDVFGQCVISREYNSDMLASAIALHEGYRYEPDSTCYWKQSHNENNSFLFVTTNHINRQIIDSIKMELKEDEFLLISCKSFDSNAIESVKNISIKKIPQSLLENCEFGVDNYNLNIVCPPVYEEDYDDE